MFTHIDVHFGRGGDTSAAQLEGAATNKRKEYREAHKSFMGIVRELQKTKPEHRTQRAAVLCDIERLERSISAKPNVVTFGVNYDDVLPKVKYITPVPGCVGPLTIAILIEHLVKDF